MKNLLKLSVIGGNLVLPKRFGVNERGCENNRCERAGWGERKRGCERNPIEVFVEPDNTGRTSLLLVPTNVPNVKPFRNASSLLGD